MTMNKGIVNKLNGNKAVTTKKESKTIFDLIKAGAKQFSAAAPKHFNSERFVRIALTEVRKNPELANCSQESLLGCLMEAARLGIEPGGVLGQLYLLPFKNKKLGTVECQLQISYKGQIELLRRSGQLSDIYAYPVYENDEFSIEYGLNRNIVHKPNFSNKGALIGIYSVAKLKDGAVSFEFMTTQEIEEHEQKYRLGQYKNNIWNKNFIEMGSKTVVKKMLKWLPISVEFIENIRNDEKINKVDIEKFENETDIEIVSEEVEGNEEVTAEELFNPETGEIIEEPKN